MRSAFVVFLGAVYCRELKLVPGTLACSAVLGALQVPKLLNRIMGNVKTKFEKLQNTNHLVRSVSVLHAWVHTGPPADVKHKVALYRNLGGAMDTDEAREMAFRIVELLLIIAK